MTYTHTHRLMAAAVTLSAALTVGAFAPASATRIVGLPESTTSDVAPQQLANTIIITLSQGNPDPMSPAPQGEVAGVTVYLTPLQGIDPTVAADVDKVTKASMQDIIESWPKGQSLASKTNADGRVGFWDIPTGVYVVTSVSPQDGKRYRGIEPFLVSMPHGIVTENAPGNPAVLVAKTYLENPPDEFLVTESPTPTPTPGVPWFPPIIPGFPPGDTPRTTTATPPAPTPGVPVTPSQPADAPSPAPSTPVKKSPVPELALTGAQVIGVVLGALALIVSGFLLLLTSRKRREEKSA